MPVLSCHYTAPNYDILQVFFTGEFLEAKHTCFGLQFLEVPDTRSQGRTMVAHFRAQSVYSEVPQSCIAQKIPAVSACISRESDPGHIDGNDVFYH